MSPSQQSTDDNIENGSCKKIQVSEDSRTSNYLVNPPLTVHLSCYLPFCRVHNARRDTHRAARTRVRTRDLDLIQKFDMQPEKKKQLEEAQEINEDLPGLGQYVSRTRARGQSRAFAIVLLTLSSETRRRCLSKYCVECAKYCETEIALRTHKRGNPHKRRVKELKEPAYTIEESLRAAGQSGSDNRQRVGPAAAASTESAQERIAEEKVMEA